MQNLRNFPIHSIKGELRNEDSLTPLFFNVIMDELLERI